MSNETHFSSVSRIDIKGITEKKEVLTGQLIRHLAPLTLSQLLRVFPLHGSVHYYDDVFCYIQTQLNIGQEKQKKVFKGGYYFNDIKWFDMFFPERCHCLVFHESHRQNKFNDLMFFANLRSIDSLTIKTAVN